jgi:hypothetical protein
VLGVGAVLSCVSTGRGKTSDGDVTGLWDKEQGLLESQAAAKGGFK